VSFLGGNYGHRNNAYTQQENARAAGINLSATLTAALQREISGSEADRWKRENRAAMQELNSITEEHGLLSDDYRSF